MLVWKFKIINKISDVLLTLFLFYSHTRKHMATNCEPSPNHVLSNRLRVGQLFTAIIIVFQKKNIVFCPKANTVAGWRDNGLPQFARFILGQLVRADRAPSVVTLLFLSPLLLLLLCNHRDCLYPVIYGGKEQHQRGLCFSDKYPVGTVLDGAHSRFSRLWKFLKTE